MQVVQLYINNQRVELFDDETISLTQTIQNVKDISKVFTDFSKSFTIPASKTNNAIFKHYYNYDINNGFDARKKVDARIDLNTIPFKEGKIKLEGVDLRNNKPYAYRITFFGNTIDLKEILGDDKLSSLNWLSNFFRDYNSTTVKADLQTDGIDFTIDSVTYTDALCIPLIGCKTRLYYDSGTHGSTDVEYPSPNGGNLYYEGGAGSHHHGVYWEELKYAIRIYLIVKAIEEAYDDIEFTSDSFIKDTTNNQFHFLYMWLHRRKGFAFDDVTGDVVTQKYTGFSDNTSTFTRAFMVDDAVKIFGLTGNETISYNLDITRITGTDPFTIYIKKDGVVYAQQAFSSTPASMSGVLTNSSTGYEVFIEGTPVTNVFNIEWDLVDSALSESGSFTGAAQSLSSTVKFNAQEQIPEMKVIDFLTGLFKMFNLTAYVQSDGKIKVQTLDDYYSGGTTRDITKYVDMSESSVDVALPYKEVKFEYKGRGTQVAALYEQEQAIGWGTTEYKIDNSISGDVYVVQAPFEHMQFERLRDEDDNSLLANLQVGNFLSDDGSPYFGDPLLFYRYKPASGTTISFLNDISATKSAISVYCVPFNSVSYSPFFDDDTCHFSVEINEFSPSSVFDGSLFANYYQSYISDVFNSKRRLTKVKAYLPVGFLLSYSLADTLRIADRSYRINSITTNLQTGESELELLNIV